MKPETAAHLDKADRCLSNATVELAGAATQLSLAEDAGRNAYYAAFHAAKAFLFERTGRTHKRHGSVQTEFNQLAKTEASIDLALRSFLPRAYDFKRIADYDIGPVGKVSPATAAAAVAEATRFVSTIRTLVP